VKSRSSTVQRLFVVGLIALLVAACSSSSDTKTTAASTASGPKGTLRLVVPGFSGEDLDPGLFKTADESTYLPILYDALIFFDPATGKLAPSLATKWDRAADGTLTFTLRSDAKFHDGSPVTSEDVKFSIERYIGRGTPKLAPAAGARLGALIDTIETPSPTTVVFKSKGLAPAMLDDLAPNGGIAPYIVPKAVVAKLGDAEFNKHPVGSGPFKFLAQEIGRSMDFEVNTAYWGTVPSVAKLSLQTVPDISARLAMLSGGQADIVSGINGPAIPQVEGDKSLKIVSSKAPYLAFMTFGAKTDPSSPFSKVDVRRAMAMAVDREGIIKSQMFGKGAPASFMHWPQGLGFPKDADSKAYKYDPTAAKALLAKAGATDFTFVMYAPIDSRDLAQAVAQNFRDVGLKPDLRIVDIAEDLKQLSDPASQKSTRLVQVFGYTGVTYRRDNSGTAMNHLIPGVNPVANATGDADWEALMKGQAAEGDEAKREASLMQGYSRVNEQVYTLPLWYVDANFGLAPTVAAYTPISGAPYPYNLQSVKLK
jgi:peptide/nickel transport system substrate-binding protein